MELTTRDIPRREPPRRTDYYSPRVQDSAPKNPSPWASRELNRRPEIGNSTQGKTGAQKYGIERFDAGDRVLHAMFGEGTVISSRDMGGDVLYEVNFDSGVTKKLMATYAKLQKL